MTFKTLLSTMVEGSIINFLVNDRTVLLGDLVHFYQDFWDENNHEYNSYIKDYIELAIDTIEWTDEALYVWAYTEDFLMEEE